MKPGHDAALAVLDGRRLVYSLECEKDSYLRHKAMTSETFLAIAERLGEVPDVFALGGWEGIETIKGRPVATGYSGVTGISERVTKLFGKEVTVFSSTHERSHLATARGMAPEERVDAEAVLIWEGIVGSLVHLDHRLHRTRRIPVLDYPGGRYAMVYAIAAPFAHENSGPFQDYAGKLMALAAFGDPKAADDEIKQIVDRLLSPTAPLVKKEFAGTSLYNAGVESEVCKHTAALLTQRLFEKFATAARDYLPAGLPLRISGGCGLNCDWNSMWREQEHFSSVFVPPCPNDSGSAIGTAIDALDHLTGDPHISWDVYQGLEFDCDVNPDPGAWQASPVVPHELSAALGSGRVVAWVEGRWEIGPRALGHRSLLAEPFQAATRDKLNTIKKRESYRPIAPICRIEDAATVFQQDFADPYMLYFRLVRSRDLGAVTHVDGSARAQTVTARSNPAIHELLSAFAQRHGVGVLCNTSLNFNGYGFINRMSDLIRYCDERGIDDMVVDGTWYQRRQATADATAPGTAGA